MSKYFIGLMTGTSADSIDGCVVDFSNGFELIHSKSNNLENDEFDLNNEDSDFQDLINRLKEIKSTIALLEKTIFK